MKELKLKIQLDLTKKYYIILQLLLLVKKDLNRKKLKARAIWRGQLKTSKCLIFIVVPRKIEKKESEKKKKL